ncbi:hypothetical protein [uncultured Gammaproteobacteria bacterium]|nr:hypothetical protein [uncultured Gammaproteobacteria bacterium]
MEFEKVANCHCYFFVLAKSWVVYGKKSLFFLLYSVKYCQSKYSVIVLNV